MNWSPLFCEELRVFRNEKPTFRNSLSKAVKLPHEKLAAQMGLPGKGQDGRFRWRLFFNSLSVPMQYSGHHAYTKRLLAVFLRFQSGLLAAQHRGLLWEFVF